MSNHAYARFWCRDFDEANMLELYERFLEVAPFSDSEPGFLSLTIQAVSPAETPIAEHDLRLQPATAAEILAACREHTGDDVLYESAAAWDLWLFEAGRWQKLPHRLDLACYGPAFDDGALAELGHFQVDAGLEHLFTGHAGLLGSSGSTVAEHPDEAAFLRYMAEPAHLREYHEKTRENIARLLDLANRVQAALPIERFVLWSEGEENFEARLDEILAAR